MIVKYISFLVGLTWSYSLIKTQSIFSKKKYVLASQVEKSLYILMYLVKSLSFLLNFMLNPT